MRSDKGVRRGPQRRSNWLARLETRFKRMFHADQARIVSPVGRMFLLIGYKCDTRQDPGYWTRNGIPYHFEYVTERVVASGDTYDELVKSARTYKRLLDAEAQDAVAVANVGHHAQRLCGAGV